MHLILRFLVFNIFIFLSFVTHYPSFVCLSMHLSSGCQTFTLSFLAVLPFFQDFCFYYSHYFLNSAWFSLLQLPPLSVPVIVPVPIKFGVKLGTFECPAGGSDPVVTGVNCKNCRGLYTPACTLRRLLNWETLASDNDKCHRCPHWHTVCTCDSWSTLKTSITTDLKKKYMCTWKNHLKHTRKKQNVYVPK